MTLSKKIGHFHLFMHISLGNFGWPLLENDGFAKPWEDIYIASYATFFWCNYASRENYVSSC